MRTLALSLAVALATVACSKSEENKPQQESPAAPAAKPAATTASNESTGSAGGGGGANAEAKTIFNTRCATCHGPDGKGNGPAAVTLNPKPRNYTDKAWQASVTDDHLREIIVKGGAAVGKSSLMPPNPDLENKPDVVNGLVQIVRSFGK